MLRSRSFTIASVLLATLAVAWPADAQFGPGRNNTQRAAYDHGYREGLRLGEQDALARRAHDAQRHGVYRRGDAGYQRRHGSREAYQQAFRSGFMSGYSDGFRRVSGSARGGYPGSGPRAVPRYPAPRQSPGHPGYPYPGGGRYGYGNFAFDNGFSDGYERGLNDGQRNRRFDPVGQRVYRSADRGYDRRFGSRDQYRAEYRNGFRRGYEEGYRDAQRYRSRGSGRWPF